MGPEARNEFDVKYDDRVRKIRYAASVAIKQLDEVRSATMAREALDAQVARIAQENLHPYGCDLIAQQGADGIMRFMIKFQSTGRGYDLIRSFSDYHAGLNSRAKL
ncbi:MAG: hypothetical protein QOH39_2290 [Verrucomicrobiota bacterium]|jgi:hypothetical protein